MYKITTVYERGTKEPKESAQYRVGRTGEIIHLDTKLPFVFAYTNDPKLEGKLLRTSPVEVLETGTDEYIIHTENSVYIIHKVEEE